MLVEKTDRLNLIVGQSHFIKTVEERAGTNGETAALTNTEPSDCAGSGVSGLSLWVSRWPERQPTAGFSGDAGAADVMTVGGLAL